MAFQYGPYVFDQATIDLVSNGHGVYGLSRGTGYFGNQPVAYVGKSSTLRDRLNYWFKNPPGNGLTHFYAEAFGNEAAMTAREEQLIKELQPVLNTLLK